MHRKVLLKNSCDIADFAIKISSLIPSVMIKESESLSETQTWSISEYLENVMPQLDVDCTEAFVKTSQFTILQNNAPYVKSGLSIVDNTLVLDKSVPALHKVNIVLTS